MSKQAPRFAMECPACGGPRQLGCRMCAACLSSAKSARISERLKSDPEFKAKRNAYKILTRKRKAESLGRKDFVPHSMRPVLVDARALLREADRIVAQVTATNRKAESDAHKASDSYRESVNAAFREEYARDKPYQVGRVRAYKASNPERNNTWNETRVTRIELQSDGSATATAIAAAKREARQCAYCLMPFDGSVRKVTDHVMPVCRGGAHSMSNIVICCEPCNLSKAKLTPDEWFVRRSAA